RDGRRSAGRPAGEAPAARAAPLDCNRLSRLPDRPDSRLTDTAPALARRWRPGGFPMPVTTLAFCDLPDRIRLALRDAIDDAGGHVWGYCGPYVQVAIPFPSGPFFR